MPRSLLLFAAAWLATALVATSPAAQTHAPPPKPYAPVAVVLPAASADPAFTAFRGALAAVARRRVYAALGRLVRPQGFFWDRDFDHGFDPQRPAVDNLAAAIALEHENGSGWQLLAAMAAETAVEPLASRPGVFCAPARPAYDGVALARLLDATHTGPADWAYPRQHETPVLEAPRPDAATLGTLGLFFVRLVEFEGGKGEPPALHRQWARVATPGARVGFVAPGHLTSLTSDRLCYVRNLADWQIAGYVAGGR
jgi:hypothetical protein